MAVRTIQYKRCAWLLNILNAHGPITREEIMYYWADDKIANEYGDPEIPLRTFQKTLRATELYFDIVIKCNRSTNEYYIEGGRVPGISRTKKASVIDIAARELNHWQIDNIPVQVFRIDAIKDTARRLRENPLCPEQREVGTDEQTGLVTFEYVMKPTWEWYEAIRSLGAAVRVLYPYWLSELVRKDAQGVADMYKDDMEDKTGQAGFINPYICRIVDVKKSSLYLSIPPYFYQGIEMGLEDAKEYNVIVNPENIWHLIQLDLEKDEEIRDEEGNAVPVHYDTIHFKMGNDRNAPEMIVEVKKIEVFDLTGEDEKTQRQYVTDENGEVIKDLDGNNVPPEFDEDGNCINGKLWNEEVVTYTLGKVLQTWELKK